MEREFWRSSDNTAAMMLMFLSPGPQTGVRQRWKSEGTRGSVQLVHEPDSRGSQWTDTGQPRSL